MILVSALQTLELLPITRQLVKLDSADNAESIIAIDINERNITTTVLDESSRETLAQLTLDYGQVNQKRQRYYDIKHRCQEHDKHSVIDDIGSHVENYTEWMLHRLSKVIECYLEWFPDPVVVFESLEGIRNGMDYGSYMDRRLHKLPFHEFERQVTYKSHRHGAPVRHVESEYNLQRCACCGEKGSRNGGRFTCTNDACGLEQDHADRNASMNARCDGLRKSKIAMRVIAVRITTGLAKPRRKYGCSGSGRDITTQIQVVWM